jgi:hypothetical protein
MIATHGPKRSLSGADLAYLLHITSKQFRARTTILDRTLNILHDGA